MITAVGMMRNEADIAATVVRHLQLEGVDRVLVADNNSTDDTREILEGLGVDVVDDPDPAYRQAEKMTGLALKAHDEGADWVLPFDADEFWYSDLGTLASVIPQSPVDVLAVQGWDHIGEGLSPRRRPEPQTYPKVLFRAHPDAKLSMGNHDVTHPGRGGLGPLGYRHFQYRSAAQMRAKVRAGAEAYSHTDYGPEVGAHWKEAAQLSDLELDKRWLMLCAEKGLMFDPAPIRRDVTVSIVIPTLGQTRMLDDCVESVRETTGIVPHVQVDEHAEGFAVTCNRGAKETSGDLVVFLNDDTVCTPGWLDALTRRAEWGVVGAHLLYPDGRTQHSGVWFDNRGVLEAHNRLQASPSGPMPAVTGACLLVQRSVFDRLGGFDEAYLNGYEDVDLCLRHRADGGRVFFASDAQVVHLESRSPGRFDHATRNIALLNERWADALKEL